MWTIAGLIVGVLFIAVGQYFLYSFRKERPLIEKEVELFKKQEKENWLKGKRFVEDEGYMDSFHTAQSEWDLVSNERNIKVMKVLIALGVVILVVTVLFWVF